MMKITILGSTGSIGRNTLDVISRNQGQFEVIALTANYNIDLLFKQCVNFSPRYAVVSQPNSAKILQEKLQEAGIKTEVLSGAIHFAMVASLSEVDCVMAAIVGAAGLLPTLAAAHSGKKILLANKEALVMSGALLMQTVQHNNATLLPVDSEHNAIFQCLPADYQKKNLDTIIRRLILTASGGAFRDFPLKELSHVTPEQACTHPNWVMGKKVTVDSATMMNKALEVIEAHWLFGLPPSKISVVQHPQSVIHSLVEYCDGSLLAQLGCSDMRIPIANCLAWPQRILSGANFLDLLSLKQLDFTPLCLERYPSLNLGYQALAAGGTATTLLNAANEEAVSAFLTRQILFTDIAKINATILEKIPTRPAANVEIILEADQKARQEARRWIKHKLTA